MNPPSTGPMLLRSAPGVKRDGTKLDGDNYVDAQWTRFQRGLPRKIGGYRAVNRELPGIPRGFNAYSFDGTTILHAGDDSSIYKWVLDNQKNAGTIVDRTPGTGFPSDPDNSWTFDVMYDGSSTAVNLVAYLGQNLLKVDNNAEGLIYYGSVFGDADLFGPVALPAGANSTGGICCVGPYLFYFGTGGIIGWSVAGEPSDLVGLGSGIARPTGQKIIKGMPVRGGGPSALFWSMDAVIKASFTGGATVFQFDTIATETSIMSANTVVDYDGVIFWAGVDRFLMYNGVVREVPNALNMDHFFDHIRPESRGKVFAFKVPRYGEIWWCYPRDGAAECDHAVIYNMRENTWYDTKLPNGGRSAAIYVNNLAAPLLGGVDSEGGEYRAWLHEQGVDEVDGSDIEPIAAWFETGDINAQLSGQPRNSNMRIQRIEPDFVQKGKMTAQITGRATARGKEQVSRVFTFEDSAPSPEEEIIVMDEQRRQLRVRFESNALGGDFQAGAIIAHLGLGDGKTLK